jgi:hypothetical protein
MKKIYPLILLLISYSVIGQNSFQKIYGSNGGSGSCVIQTNDNGYVVLGELNYSSSTTGPSANVYLSKTDFNGNLLWSKTFGDGDLNRGNFIIQTSDNGFLIVGTNGDPLNKVVVLKTNSTGDLLWAKYFDGEVEANVQQTSDGNYIIVSGRFINKIDTSGNLIWCKMITAVNINDYDDYTVKFVQQTNDGGFILCGSVFPYASNNIDLLLLKTNSTGDILWSRKIGGYGWELGYSVKQLPDGSLIVLGSSTSYDPMNIKKIYLFKTNASGNQLWTKTYGVNGSRQNSAHCLDILNDGGILIGGSTELGPPLSSVTNGYSIKTDSSGSLTN